MTDYVYDIETYPNIFTFCSINTSTGELNLFEISDRKNEFEDLMIFLNLLKRSGSRMIGFNNINFDYPVIHYIMTNWQSNCFEIYKKAISIIKSNDKFGHVIWDNDRYIEQIDLFKINHFDNKAKSTSLKIIEFNRRSLNIKDLPFEPGTFIPPHRFDELILYNIHDVQETMGFLKENEKAIKLREELTQKFNRNFMNHNDTKIGKDYFIMRLGDDLCYERVNGRRQPRQTIREHIDLNSIIFPYIKFKNPEFNRILTWLKSQKIKETKGIFSDLSCTVNNFEFSFGTGGIHGSIESCVVHSDDQGIIFDVDVASFYPNIAIKNKLFPQHLSQEFSIIYEDIYNTRKLYKKGTPENAVFKLALNGTYGDSNNQYSPFYDPAFTMSITINGQLLLCMLAEMLFDIPELRLIQINTDGLTVKIPENRYTEFKTICDYWQQYTLLELEENRYSKMFIRDVNNYIAVYEDGKIKRKGAYEYKLAWHQNHSALVIPKAVESVLVNNCNLEHTITNHADNSDFMLRTKVPRTSKLMLGDTQIQNISRYYVSREGDSLVKVMPPLKDKVEDRRIGIDVGWTVKECNHARDFNRNDVNYDYYIEAARKLINPIIGGRADGV